MFSRSVHLHMELQRAEDGASVTLVPCNHEINTVLDSFSQEILPEITSEANKRNIRTESKWGENILSWIWKVWSIIWSSCTTESQSPNLGEVGLCPCEVFPFQICSSGWTLFLLLTVVCPVTAIPRMLLLLLLSLAGLPHSPWGMLKTKCPFSVINDRTPPFNYYRPGD